MKILRAMFLAAIVALLASACSTTNPEIKAVATPQARPVSPPPQAQTAPSSPAPTPIKNVEAPASMPLDPLDDPKNILSRRSVYFDFDRSFVRQSDIPVVDAHARYLVDHGDRRVRVEGNCDERGGREYNLALGQRRADAVRQHLKDLGVSADRVETISLGKEHPRNPGHGDVAWAENRRADIIYR